MFGEVQVGDIDDAQADALSNPNPRGNHESEALTKRYGFHAEVGVRVRVRFRVRVRLRLRLRLRV